ncbi:excinuclease ATPase subunit [Larsenimonas rhizosphaerae]|uniref:Excinuclease ATPase subunit n=1 Tax=Larsenimonas rhizosphaerae TaxID=2944682 RepID=A0AA42CUR4_9GAMM|nr:excinuclease ATPase subunit [Larsenimonas rhizosphaerae]MCM2131726.1 excinuclease ATPase subunit [Larsenimonas rhizosphaerae]MCX2524947.1 excinuclease ATPase subunit [Larsenimonas rhizosphaerae]
MMRCKTLAASLLSVAVVTLGWTGQAQARNTQYFMPFKDVLSLPQAREELDPTIRLYFGNQVHPEVQDRHGGYYTDRTTSSITKSDEEACRWVALSALIDLQQRARLVGANAVTNIASYYDKRDYINDENYECHAGNVVTGVALKGNMVTLPPQ